MTFEIIQTSKTHLQEVFHLYPQKTSSRLFDQDESNNSMGVLGHFCPWGVSIWGY